MAKARRSARIAHSQGSPSTGCSGNHPAPLFTSFLPPPLMNYLMRTVSLLVLFALLPASARAQQTNSDGFGTTDNVSSYLTPFNGNLIAVTGNDGEGEVWSYDGNVWTNIHSLGLDNLGAFDPSVFQSLLYVGTYNEVTGCEVWEYDDITPSWTRVDPGGGFGDTQNIEVSGTGVHGGRLFVGTRKADPLTGTCLGAEVWTYDPILPSGSRWANITPTWGANICEADGFVEYQGAIYTGVSNATTGCEVWRYDDTNGWLRVDPVVGGQGGFHESWKQPDARGMAVCGAYLFVGTKNSVTGCEVWRYDGNFWFPVGDKGFGGGRDEEVTGLHCLGSTLFAATQGAGSNPGALLRYEGGFQWTDLTADGFCDVTNTIVESLTEYEGVLHASTFNAATGTEVWRVPSASATVRNAGSNPASYTLSDLPILGETISAAIDVGGTGHGFGQLFGFGGPLSFSFSGGRVLLIDVTDPGGELLALPTLPGPIAAYSLPVPADCVLLGFELSTQALHFGGAPWVLSNAQDIILGW